MDRESKTEHFRQLHHGSSPLLIPNPWDLGSVRILEGLGFQALATTSLGAAMSAGTRRADARLLLENCRMICDATTLPVSLDFENGFVDSMDDFIPMMEEAYATGAVGISIEDSTGVVDSPVFPFDTAVERVRAAVTANQALPVPMVLTARAEILFHKPDAVDEALARIRAFEVAGVDVIYVPYIRDLDTMQRVVAAVSLPVNVVMGFGDPSITLADLKNVGVGRISIGGAFYRLAVQRLREIASMMRDGDFGFVADLEPLSDILSSFGQGEN